MLFAGGEIERTGCLDAGGERNENEKKYENA